MPQRFPQEEEKEEKVTPPAAERAHDAPSNPKKPPHAPSLAPPETWVSSLPRTGRPSFSRLRNSRMSRSRPSPARTSPTTELATELGNGIRTPIYSGPSKPRGCHVLVPPLLGHPKQCGCPLSFRVRLTPSRKMPVQSPNERTPRFSAHVRSRNMGVPVSLLPVSLLPRSGHPCLFRILRSRGCPFLVPNDVGEELDTHVYFAPFEAVDAPFSSLTT